MIYSSCCSVLLVLLELVNLLSGRPQTLKPFSNVGIYNQSGLGETSRRLARNTKEIARGNNGKAERILNTNNRRGPAPFGGFSEQDIIFPDSFEVVFKPIPRIDGSPKCADGNTFCEDFDSYPYFHLKDILRTRNVNKDFFFGEDDMPPQVETRVDVGETFVCGAVERLIFPKVGKNKDNEWRYIVNQGKDEGYVQGVRTETCIHHGRPCDIIGELPEGYRTSCKQKYIYRRLMSLDEGGVPMPDTFQMPSACCCSYRRDVDSLARFGRPITPIN